MLRHYVCIGVWVVCLLLLSCTSVAAQGAAAPRRTALVIGNAAYQNAPHLRNPVHDATDIAATLQRLGFEVTTLRNAGRRAMVEALEAYNKQLRRGGVGLFYFAGHGIQVDGQNYLIPIDALINREPDVQFVAVPVGYVLGIMKDAANELNIIILDACRDNPFARSFRNSADGLVPVQAARGSLIAYATAPGEKAADGGGRNGVYTQHLLQAITTPGLSVEQVFKKVRNEVIKVTSNKKTPQTPWESSSLIGEDFYFVSPQPTVPKPPEAPPGGGTKYRLPTEAEWEYAARAGTETTVYTGGAADPREEQCARAGCDCLVRGEQWGDIRGRR